MNTLIKNEDLAFLNFAILSSSFKITRRCVFNSIPLPTTTVQTY